MAWRTASHSKGAGYQSFHRAQETPCGFLASRNRQARWLMNLTVVDSPGVLCGAESRFHQRYRRTAGRFAGWVLTHRSCAAHHAVPSREFRKSNAADGGSRPALRARQPAWGSPYRFPTSRKSLRPGRVPIRGSPHRFRLSKKSLRPSRLLVRSSPDRFCISRKSLRPSRLLIRSSNYRFRIS